MKKYLIFCVVIVFLLLFFCADPPVTSETCNEPGKYLHVNSFVSKSIQNNFQGLLPAEIMERTNAEYYYHYQCAVLGDPAFVVYLKNEYPDSGKFQDEKKRVAALLPCEIILDEYTKLYVAEDVQNQLELYLNDVIEDGTSFYIEMAIINTQSQTIEYLSALQWDSHKRDDYVMKFVNCYLN